MNTSLSAITRRGFTLIEVLMALGICALLAAATAAAISFAARAERMAIRSGEAALLLPSSMPPSVSIRTIRLSARAAGESSTTPTSWNWPMICSRNGIRSP